MEKPPLVSSRDMTAQWLTRGPQSHLWCSATRARPLSGQYSLVAPVQAGGDVALHILHPVVGEMPHKHLPPQVQDFIHDVPQPVEEIAFISLGDTQMRKFNGQSRRHGVTTEETGGSPAYPLCAGHAVHRFSMNRHTLPSGPQRHSLLYMLSSHFTMLFSCPRIQLHFSDRPCPRVLTKPPHPSLVSGFTYSASLSTSNPLSLAPSNSTTLQGSNRLPPPSGNLPLTTLAHILFSPFSEAWLHVIKASSTENTVFQLFLACWS